VDLATRCGALQGLDGPPQLDDGTCPEEAGACHFHSLQVAPDFWQFTLPGLPDCATHCLQCQLDLQCTSLELSLVVQAVTWRVQNKAQLFPLLVAWVAVDDT